MTHIDETGRSAEEAAADIADAVRSLNHVTLDAASLEFPSEVYGILADLYTATGRLPQALQQLAQILSTQRDTGRLTLDDTTRHTDPNVAVTAVIEQLHTAAHTLEAVTHALTEAQNDIAAVAINDPAVTGNDP